MSDLSDNEDDADDVTGTSIYAHLQDVRNFSPDLVDTHWLDIPRVFMQPPLMPTSTDVARVVDASELLTTSATVLTLFARGGTCMPEHFSKMLAVLALINKKVHSLSGFVVGTPNSVLNEAPRGKTHIITSVSLKVKVAPIASHETNFIETDAPIDTSNALAAAQISESAVYVLQELCTVEWGVIPFRYVTDDGDEVRDIFQVLKVLPCHGFDLVAFVQSIASSSVKMSRTLDSEFDEACKLLTQVVYQEMINLNISAHLFPDPLTSESPFSPTSIVSVMSPFMIVRKMLRHIPGGFCGLEKRGPGIQSLEIHGVPSLEGSSNASAAIRLYDQMHRKYIEFLSVWSAGVKTQNRDVSRLPPLLFRDNGEFVAFGTAVDLKVYPSFKENKDLLTKKIVFPLLVTTLLTNFKFVFQGDEARWQQIREAYIVAQCGRDQSPLTPLRLHQIYTSASTLGYPEAGMFSGLRKAMQQLLLFEGVADDVNVYMQYMRYCQTVCVEQQVEGFYISERVRHGACLLRRASASINAELAPSIRAFSLTMSVHENQIMQDVLHDELMYTAFMIHRTFCGMNKWTKATAINLSLVYACVVSDILCFLGMDNSSWTWTYYPILVCGGGGHLRALTEDGHAQRSECIYLAKASSVGFNAVVVSTMNAILGLVTNVFPDVPNDVVRILQLQKMDRITRTAIEEFSAVLSTNSQIFQVPEKDKFMCAVSFDELSRNVSEDALNGLITNGYPRDRSGGCGTTQKSTESRTRGPREKQETRSLRGFLLNGIPHAQNRNASNATVAESYKALVTGAMACFVPSAQPSPGFPSLTQQPVRKKHRCNQHESCDAAGEIQMPHDTEICKSLAWILNVVPMNCRSLGLLNKVGMTQINVNEVEQQLYKWFGSIVQSYFRCFLGATLSLSFWRMMNGYLSRSVASAFYVENMLCQMQNDSFETANFETLVHMESGIGLHSLNNALLDALTHMIDFNLIVSNKIVAHKLDTPCLPLDFLRAMFNEERDVNTRFPDETERLKQWLVTRFLTDSENRLQHGFVPVKNIGTVHDYQFYAQYLENYCSIVLGSFHTYHQCFLLSSRIIDLSDFFSLEVSMLRCRFHGMGIASRIDTLVESNLANAQPTFIHCEKNERADRFHVHLAQHLLLTSLMGTAHLHSENVHALGKTLYSLIMSETAVQQAVPGGVLSHMFDTEFGSVVPSHVKPAPRRHYMARSRKDIAAWMNGRTSELCGFLDVHPIEDVLHVGSWLHYAELFKCDDAFAAQPFPPLRSLELVPGRVYPMQSQEHGDAALCISPRGQNHVVVCEADGARFFSFANWNLYVVFERQFQVAPLVFRPNAVVYTAESKLGVLVAWDSLEPPEAPEHGQREQVRAVLPYNYLDLGGNYQIEYADGQRAAVHWRETHGCLLPLGTYLFVRRTDAMKTPRACEWVRGWLRYPDESSNVAEDNDPRRVYVAFRVAKSDETFDDTSIKGFAMEDCAMAVLGNNYCDYLLSMI